MAHELEIVNGKAQMAYVGDTPWHGLGTKLPQDVTPHQMLEAAGLDWTVERHPQFVEINGDKIFTGKQALVRSTDNKIIDTVTDEWNPVQNEEAFEFFNDFVGAGDMEMHTAGSLKGGQIVWGLAKVKDSFELFGGDKVDSYLLFTNPHRFGQAIDIRFTPIRVVCNNTLTMSLNAKSQNVVKVNHRKLFDGDEVKQMLGVAQSKLNEYKEVAAFLGNKRYTAESLIEYYNTVFPLITTKRESRKEMSKSAARALELVHEQPGANFAEGSWWQAFNAVTYLVDHEVGRSVDSRLQSAWFGPNKQLKVRAMEKAVEYAEAA